MPNRENNTVKTSKNIGTNTLFVPRGGIYKLVLPDGSKVWLNSSSSLKYPTSFEGNKRIVELSGEAYFEVKKDATKDFIVKTKMRDISVLGTSFNVSAYNDDAFFAATLAEGKIKLVGDQQKEVYLKPGEQAVVVKKDSNTVQVKNVNPQVYSAWKDGTFFFENMSLDNILRKVGRWYNFKTDFSDVQLSEITFTGLASKEFPAKRLLDRISKSANVSYEIIQNTENNDEYLVKISRKEP
jgi:ferric-dicitrate binding protein FerR (iron transport regulator)